MYSFNTRIRYSETDMSGRLSPLSLLDYFQDLAIFHSEEVGIGVSGLKEKETAWVLGSWQIDINEMPCFNEDVVVSTFPYQFKGFVGYRNFLLENKEGKRLAVANSVWSYINMNTKKPERITDEMLQMYGFEEKLDMDYSGKKLRPPVGVNPVVKREIAINVHNLDTNNHVNNTQYVRMASKYIPQEWEIEGKRISRIRAEYKMQALLGDVLIPSVYVDGNIVLVIFNNSEGKAYANVEFVIS